MDWASLGLGDHVIEWLEAVAAGRYARDRRLDPFATSMRDFDDVTPDLRSLRSGNRPDVSDPQQRITDLRNAGLADEGAGVLGLTPLGGVVLKAWEEYGVSSDEIADELARHILLVLEASRLCDSSYKGYVSYWRDLRSSFDPLALIQHWNALYALNYLDAERAGFTPSHVYRDEAIDARDIEFDLGSYAEDNIASDAALQGAARVEQALDSKISRGRHRATFCMALEVVLSGGASAHAILEQFGIPKKPKIWTKFEEANKRTVRQILLDYQLTPSDSVRVSANATGTDDEASLGEEYGKLAKLPVEIDFAAAQVAIPNPGSRESSGTSVSRRGPRKVDGKKKAHKNELVGNLGEEFAIRYERWRLRNDPDLLERVLHVSMDDDTLGYDIESAEIDGTPRFVEVKGSLGPVESRFFVTPNELQCADRKKEAYVILRVAQLRSRPVFCEIRYPLDRTLTFEPDVYTASFKQR